MLAVIATLMKVVGRLGANVRGGLILVTGVVSGKQTAHRPPRTDDTHGPRRDQPGKSSGNCRNVR
jgi:hypothetical protein